MSAARLQPPCPHDMSRTAYKRSAKCLWQECVRLTARHEKEALILFMGLYSRTHASSQACALTHNAHTCRADARTHARSRGPARSRTCRASRRRRSSVCRHPPRPHPRRSPPAPPLARQRPKQTRRAGAKPGWSSARERGRLSYMRHGIARETNMKTNMKTVRISPTQHSEQTRKRLEIVAEERWRRCG